MTRALIVGCEGQDGQYLTAHLGQLDYQVTGVARDCLYVDGKYGGPAIDICDGQAMGELIASFEPDEIYHLAAHHHSSDEDAGDEGALFRLSFATHVDALLVLLEAMRKSAPQARLFYAASSLVFGEPSQSPQNEETPISPVCAYGITKAAGLQLCRYYRQTHGLFCATGILYTHESPRRPASFISRRIVQTAIAIAEGKADKLVLGDPKAVIDWGYAPDYVNAMHRVLQLDDAEDFIVASGKARRVREFIDAVFAAIDIPSAGHIHEDASLFVRKPRRVPLVGDYSKLSTATGWRPQRDLEDIAQLMVDAERGS